jgi:hypothetical protein
VFQNVLTIRYRNTGKRSAKWPGPYYIDGSVRQPALAGAAEPDIWVREPAHPPGETSSATLDNA